MNSTTTSKKPAARTYTMPKGYEVKWSKPGYDLLKRTAAAKGDGPAWYVTCNAHGTMTDATSAKDGDVKGTKAGRAGWCKGDHKPAAPTAKKSPAKTAATKAAAPAKKTAAKKSTAKTAATKAVTDNLAFLSPAKGKRTAKTATKK